MGENGKEMGHGRGARGEWERMEGEGNETFYFMPFFFFLNMLPGFCSFVL